MKKRKLCNISAVLILVSTLFAVSSCIKEDLSDCPPESASLRVRFSFDTDDDAGDVNLAGVTEKATLYIFDRNNRFVGQSSRNDIVVGQEYELDLNLAPDAYNFVVWINEDTPYYTTPAFSNSSATTDKGNATLKLELPANRTCDFTLPRLRHSKADNEVITGKDHVIHFPLIQNTNTILFTVNGLKSTSDNYSFNIADNNGVYDFDNNFAYCEAINYTAATTFTQGLDVLNGTMSVFRLTETRSPQLSFKNNTTGQTLYPSYAGQETNLIKLILKAYAGKTINFDRRHVFRITLNFDAKMSATILVDGWKVNESGSELYPD